jgi:glycosyltransferase involved in cell wall biosynthesis
VLSQTYNDYEIIIIDDGSTDDTADIINNYKDISYTNIKHSGLPAIARNIGISKAKGEYIAFLDSDDIWLPQKLEKEIEIFNNNPGIGLVCSNAYFLKINYDSNELYLKINQEKSGKVFCELLKDNFIITSSVIIRRSILDKSGVFSENPDIRALEDYYLWLSIALITDVFYIPEPLLRYRDHIGSIRTQQTIMSYINARVLIQKQIRSQVLASNDQYEDIKTIIDDIDYSIALLEYDKSVAMNNNALSIRGLIKLLSNRPRNILGICRYIAARLLIRRKYCSIINFVSPWTNRYNSQNLRSNTK